MVNNTKHNRSPIKIDPAEFGVVKVSEFVEVDPSSDVVGAFKVVVPFSKYANLSSIQPI